MNHCAVTTAHGPLYLVGRLHADRRPALLVMGGFGGAADNHHEMVDWYPGVTVLVAPFPGTVPSTTPDWDVARMSRMVDEAVGALLTNVPVVALGVSAGCLVTLGLRAPQIVRHVAVEPFFHTARLWPLHAVLRDVLTRKQGDTAEARAAEDLFGFTLTDVVDRDFESVLEGLSTPVDVLAGSIPLEPPRTLARWPSLMGERDRELLARHPHVTMHSAPQATGHYFQEQPAGRAVLRDVAHQALRFAATLT